MKIIFWAGIILANYTKEDLDLALHYFEKAIEIDPNYADAYLGIAAVWMSVHYIQLRLPRKRLRLIKTNVAKAFKLDSTSSEYMLL